MFIIILESSFIFSSINDLDLKLSLLSIFEKSIFLFNVSSLKNLFSDSVLL